MSDRMSFLCANIVQDDFSSDLAATYNVALYFHIAHLLPPEINADVLKKVVQTLKPGGVGVCRPGHRSDAWFAFSLVDGAIYGFNHDHGGRNVLSFINGKGLVRAGRYG